MCGWNRYDHPYEITVYFCICKREYLENLAHMLPGMSSALKLEQGPEPNTMPYNLDLEITAEYVVVVVLES